ncbi:MAG TPA: threonylcarbamoyl-AMP synthase [Candidatus Ruania gallistercoris]|uniref:L-threonylcarbamoyladenylate synthase n=1 Tax=Candidatus Ruania gallistercoris TaxID=2838746 RepID=A0A9D2J540_9MICO|nr:threonylcarbamoyl-AMP synthase [Candidatus Ruania gallistercoris]
MRAGHLTEAVRQLAEGRLVVLPTDTVYGIAADAFTPRAVTSLLTAKGRDRQMPPPVLIGDLRTLDGLATEIPTAVRDLVEEFWPGPLTIILRAHGSLRWDLGETHGTVALRMPDHEITLELLRRTGPLAVSSANRSGEPAALTCAEAAEQLGRSVKVYLDGGAAPGGIASTIVDATGEQLRIVREGALTAEELGSIAAELLPVHVPEVIEDEAAEESDDQGEAEEAPTSDAVAEASNAVTDEAEDGRVP